MPGAPPGLARRRPEASWAFAKWRQGRLGTRHLRPTACQRVGGRARPGCNRPRRPSEPWSAGQTGHA
eukprot:3761753-Alexandrium_andersonii.AAC.1